MRNRRTLEQVAYSTHQAAEVSSFSLRQIMKDIASGKLRSRKKGRRRIILASDLKDYLK